VRPMKSGGGAKARGVEQALDHLWPDKIPEGLSAKDRNNTVHKWLVDNKLSVPGNIARAVQRAQLRKNKGAEAPASSRAVRVAAADDKAFAEALSRRDEALANIKRRQEAAMVKK
jgi:hypothetical protein